MAKFEITAPDGKKFEVTAPDGASQEDVLAYAQSQWKPQQPKLSAGDVLTGAVQNAPKSFGNFVGGLAQAVRHPLDTGVTMWDAAAGGLANVLPKPVNEFLDKIDEKIGGTEAKKRAVTTADALGNFYKDRYGSVEGAKKAIATDPVGVLGDVSTVLTGGAALAGLTPKAAKLAKVLSTAGNATNPLTIIGKTGDVVSAVTNPARIAAAESLMGSAVKPMAKQWATGDADIAIKTLLNYGINPTKNGVEKLKNLIENTNDEISNLISKSTATVNKNKVIEKLGNVKEKFTKQVSPASDLNAIDAVQAGFESHPMIKGEQIPVQLAQALKQGTYKVVNKKYGQLGSAEIEAQKGLARGLKEGVAEAVPEIAALNAKESDLIKTLNVTERRALMDINKNPMGLALLANNPASWAAFMADKSALFKSLAARLINPGESWSQKLGTALKNKGAEPITPQQAKSIVLLGTQTQDH